MARTFDQALHGLVDLMLKMHQPGSNLRVQVLHSYNEKAVLALREMIAPVFNCNFMPINYMSPALAAHTGPTMVGIAFAPMDTFADIP
jgi:fatty acid-binding protein DegV